MAGWYVFMILTIGTTSFAPYSMKHFFGKSHNNFAFDINPTIFIWILHHDDGFNISRIIAIHQITIHEIVVNAIDLQPVSEDQGSREM